MILVLDPGEDTGWVMYEPVTRRLFGYGTWVGVQQAFIQIEFMEFDVLVTEDFVISERTLQTKREGRASLFVIGAALSRATRAGASVTLQLSTDGLAYGTERKRRALGLYGLGDEHTQSACSHLIKYLRDTDQLTARECLDGPPIRH